MKNLAFALIIAARKLRLYFQANTIVVQTKEDNEQYGGSWMISFIGN